MKTTSEIWYELYDIGINQGLESLNEKQLCLYNYIDLFYSLEMGGLSSLLYNSSGNKEKFDTTIATLRYFGLNDLAETFIQYGEKFKDADDGREETWEDFLNRTGISDDVENLCNKILSIVTEDKVENWIAEYYKELITNLK